MSSVNSIEGTGTPATENSLAAMLAQLDPDAEVGSVDAGAAADTLAGAESALAPRPVGGALSQANVDRMQDPRPTQPGTSGTDPRIPGLEAGLAQSQQENRALRERMDAKDKAEAEELRKPGFGRALIEALELVLRWFTPFVNMLSALFRIMKIGYKLLTGQKIDWMDEGLRLAGDIAGIFFPPIGALANAGMNVLKNKSQVLGGINEFFDAAPKTNGFRQGFDAFMGGLHKKAPTTHPGPTSPTVPNRPQPAAA